MQPSLQEWLNRKSAGPKPKKALRRSVRVKRVSGKRARANREYTIRRKVFLEAHPLCMAHAKIVYWAATNWKCSELAMQTWYGCEPETTPIATEIHHKKKPKCKYLNDETTWLAVARWSHEWIEANKGAARSLGLLD